MRSLASDDSHFTPRRRNGKGKQRARDDGDDSDDSQGTEVGTTPASVPHQPKKAEVVDDVGAQDAFVAGMVYALSRRLVPGAPYAPGLSSHSPPNAQDGGRWKLDECLRFATELAGGREIVHVERKLASGDLVAKPVRTPLSPGKSKTYPASRTASASESFLSHCHVRHHQYSNCGMQ